MFDELSARHYFIRAAYHWCVDLKYTPYILVRCEDNTLSVPPYLIKDGKIVFNISPAAVRELVIEKDGLFFTARFGGITREIKIELDNILAVYAQEVGKGISFPPATGGARNAAANKAAKGEAEKPAKTVNKTADKQQVTKVRII